MLRIKPIRPANLFAARMFSTSEEQHFSVEKLESGVVMFNMNRAKTRNALSKTLIDQF
jgi:hypothetical protein